MKADLWERKVLTGTVVLILYFFQVFLTFHLFIIFLKWYLFSLDIHGENVDKIKLYFRFSIVIYKLNYPRFDCMIVSFFTMFLTEAKIYFEVIWLIISYLMVLSIV